MTLAILSELHWREPLWLLLALQPVLLLLLRRLGRQRRLYRYADPALHPWVIQREHRSLLRRLFSRDSAYVLGWLLVAIAASGPRMPLEVTGNEPALGIDVMVVVDASRSMAARDVTPNRLRRVRLELQQLRAQLHRDRFGIIVYAGRPHLYVPLTRDLDAVDFYLKNLDSLVLPTHGSQTGAALQLAHEELQAASGRRVVLLITDGDFTDGSDSEGYRLTAAIDALRDDNIPLYVLGMGSVEGDAIPLPDGEWLTHEGRPLISRMDERRLRALAELGDGRYSPVSDDESDWALLYHRGMAAFAPTQIDAASIEHIIWRELYPWALLPAIVFLFVSLMPYRIGRLASATTPLSLAIVTVLAGVPHKAIHAAGRPTKMEHWAHQAYHSSDYSSATARYEAVTGYAGRLGEGASRYRLGEYTRAIRQFSQAVLEARNDRERAIALYNLGNGYFQTGNYAAAITAYRDALLYQPKHLPARQNLEFSQMLQREVEKRLEMTATKRMGSGPRHGRPAQPLDIDASGAVSVDDSVDVAASTVHTPPWPHTAGSDLEELVRRGVQHARPAASGDPELAAAAQLRAQQLPTVRRHLEHVEDRQPMLWKRLFEMEEGFPAPLEKPRNMPGAKPW